MHLNSTLPPLQQLDQDLFTHITSFLDIEDVTAIELVCQKWQEKTLNDEIWKKFVDTRLPERVKKLQVLSFKEKVKIYYKELTNKVDFVLKNPNLSIHVYLWTSPEGTPLFTKNLIDDLTTKEAKQWKSEKIKEHVNNALLPKSPDKIAAYKFTHISTDRDIEEVDALLKLGFDVNSAFSQELPTPLFTLFDVAATMNNIEKVSKVATKLIDYGIDTSKVNNSGKTAFDIAYTIPFIPKEEILALKNKSAI